MLSYLPYQAIQLGMHRSTTSWVERVTYESGPEQALGAQITWKCVPKAHGLHPCYTVFSLPAWTYDHMGSSCGPVDKGTRKSEEEISGSLSLNGQKNVKICISNMNTHQRSPQQRRILIIKLIGWPVLWIPVFLFPQSTLLSSNGLVNKVAMLAGMEVISVNSLLLS